MTINRLIQLCIFFILIPAIGYAQTLPEFGTVFLQDEVAEVHIQIHPDSLAAILHPDSLQNNHEYPATFIYSSEGIQDTLEQIGFRLRGNTSRQAAKKSFKVSFNTFIQGRKYQGLEKMNLNGSANDPSNMRAKLCWDALRHLGLRGSRTSYINLYVNDEFKGVYTHVEHIDEEFVDLHFDHGDGNLWKCLYPADLQFLGSDPAEYELEFFGRQVYELKTNQEENDYSALAEFIGTLNNAPFNTLPCSLAEDFNIKEYIRYLACDILFGNWDGYPINMNNYYLYEDPQSGVIHYIPYDLDNTLGIDFFDIDWTERDPYSWSPDPGSRPLYDAVMNIPEWRDAFNYYLESYRQDLFESGWLLNRAEELQTLISPYMGNDSYYPQDYGFSLEDFANSLSDSWGEHVNYGVEPFIEALNANLTESIESSTLDGLIDGVWDNAPLVNAQLIVSAHVSGDGTPTFQYRYNEEIDFIDTEMTFSDDIWSISIPIEEGNEFLEYQLSIDEIEGSDFFCEPERVWTSSGNSGLVINEIMASNSTSYTDEFGEYDDWVELYVQGGSIINLNSVYLSDNSEEPWRWNIPAITIESDSFQLLWIDRDTEQGDFHAPFDLDADGDELALYRIENGKWRLLDYRNFTSLGTDVSLGRFCDGEDNWTIFQMAQSSPGFSNCLPSSIFESESSEISIYPNPSKGIFNISVQSSADIYSMDGRLVSRLNNDQIIDLSGMEKGVYLVHMQDSKVYKIVLQ